MSSGNHVFLVRNLTLIQATTDGEQEKQKSVKGIKDAPQWSSMDQGSCTSCHWSCTSFYCHCSILLRFFYPWNFGWCVHPPHMASHFYLKQDHEELLISSKITYWFLSLGRRWLRPILYGVPFVWPQLMWQLFFCQSYKIG